MNSIIWTVLLTEMTANTTYGAGFHNVFAFILGTALYQMLCFIWYQLNQVLRTGCNTFSTCLTYFLIHLCNTIYNMDCIKRTCLYTVSKAKAAIATALCSAARNKCHSSTIFYSGIFIIMTGFFTGSCTFYKGNLLCAFFCSNTHDFPDFCCNRRTTNRTSIDRGITFYNSSCKTGTSGITTTTTVISRKNTNNCFFPFIYFYFELEESEAQTLQESGRLKLRFAKGVGRDLSVKLTHISEAEGGRVVAVFQGDTYLSELTLLRQQSAEVIRQTTTGIRVPKEALRVRERTVTDEDGNESVVSETGVYCMVGMKARFKPVDVLYSGDDFALVRSTLDTAEEVSKTQEQIRLRAGDEVIITAYDLYDGKVIGS